MDTKIIESMLLKNPTYSSSWIENAAKLIANFGYDESDLTDFCSEQLELIVGAHDFNVKNPDNTVDVTYIANPKLNATQMRLMLAGQQNKISVEKLTELINENIPYAVSNYTVQAAIDGKDMSKYTHDYSPDQVYEIYAGITNGLDVSIYDKSDIDPATMGLIRHALEIGKTVDYVPETGLVVIK